MIKKRHKFFLGLGIAIASVLLLLLIIFASVYIISSKNINFENDEMLFDNSKNEMKIELYYDKEGNVDLKKYEPILFEEVAFSDMKKIWYSYSEFPECLKKGFVAIEDRGFFEHHGIDLARTLKAFVNYFLKGDSSYGGSTITQQLIKNMSGYSEKTAKRKLCELIRAYNLESSHSKEEIFEVYLNIIPMSNNSYGVGYASKMFFGKEPSDLNAIECATIIAIANAPTRYNPYTNPSNCIEKRNRVLQVMYNEKVIDEKTYSESVKAPIGVITQTEESKGNNSWFSKTVMDDAIKSIMQEYEYSYNVARLYLFKNNLRIYTTVDPEVQNCLDKYFADKSNFYINEKSTPEYSMVICDSNNGVLRGMAGGVGAEKNRDCTKILRPPGSALKPLGLYLPLLNEKQITWSAVFEDAPVSYITKNGEKVGYPQNTPSVYEGRINVADALMLSKNTVAVRLYDLMGAEKVYRYLTESFGFDSIVYKREGKNGILTDLAPSPLALGQLTDGISLRSLTEAYSALASEGAKHSSRSFIAIYDIDGNIIINNKDRKTQVASAESVRLLTLMLKRVVESGTASRITLNNHYDVAGKTGTSGNNKDKLFVGYTPYYTAGVWCGYVDRSDSVGNGCISHLKVWDEVMTEIHSLLKYKDERVFGNDGLLLRAFCKESGKMFMPDCINNEDMQCLKYGFFLKGTEPDRLCDIHGIAPDIVCYNIAANSEVYCLRKKYWI